MPRVRTLFCNPAFILPLACPPLNGFAKSILFIGGVQ
jgi:hypothetical protein